jgi:hypothetical protein
MDGYTVTQMTNVFDIAAPKLQGHHRRIGRATWLRCNPACINKTGTPHFTGRLMQSHPSRINPPNSLIELFRRTYIITLRYNVFAEETLGTQQIPSYIMCPPPQHLVNIDDIKVEKSARKEASNMKPGAKKDPTWRLENSPGA